MLQLRRDSAKNKLKEKKRQGWEVAVSTGGLAQAPNPTEDTALHVPSGTPKNPPWCQRVRALLGDQAPATGPRSVRVCTCVGGVGGGP